jgi:hypothetical protein
MAFNVVETQILDDNDHTAMVKVTCVANATFNANVLVITANALHFANASLFINRLALTSLQYSTDLSPANGFVQLWWSSNNSANAVNSNTIFTFGTSDDGDFQGLIANPVANSTGDMGLTVQNMGPGNTFNFIITVLKDNFTNPGAGAWANGQAAYLDQSGH